MNYACCVFRTLKCIDPPLTIWTKGEFVTNTIGPTSIYHVSWLVVVTIFQVHNISRRGRSWNQFNVLVFCGQSDDVTISDYLGTIYHICKWCDIHQRIGIHDIANGEEEEEALARQYLSMARVPLFCRFYIFFFCVVLGLRSLWFY